MAFCVTRICPDFSINWFTPASIANLMGSCTFIDRDGLTARIGYSDHFRQLKSEICRFLVKREFLSPKSTHSGHYIYFSNPWLLGSLLPAPHKNVPGLWVLYNNKALDSLFNRSHSQLSRSSVVSPSYPKIPLANVVGYAIDTSETDLFQFPRQYPKSKITDISQSIMILSNSPLQTAPQR